MAKKKANPQSEDNKPPKTQHQIPPQTVDDAASEKLHSLKSLNAMLLKETVERRQQVDSLTQVNGSLESELNRCKSDKVSLQSELNGVTERAVMLEIEAGLVSRFVAVQVNHMAEVSRRERTAMEEKICGMERDISRVLEEKNGIEMVKNRKESEIGSLNTRLKTLVAEIGEEKFVLSKVCEERDEIRAQLDDQIQHENGLRSKLAEAEKREAVILEKSQKLKVDYSGLVEEKTCAERKVDSLLREKDSIARSLVESNGLVDDLKRDIQKIVKEKMVIEDERNVLERMINDMQISVKGLNQLVHSLQKGEERLLEKIADLEKKCVMISEEEAKMSMEIDLLVKEKQETESTIRNLTEEKSLVIKDLKETSNILEHQKLTIDQMVEEKMKIIDAKDQGEKNILQMKEQFENKILALEKSSIVQIDKLKKLESEVSHYRSALDQATTEGNKTRSNLDDEKLKVKNLSEELSKMEKGIEEICKKLSKMTADTEKLVAEKHELEMARAALAKDILVVEKSLVKTRKEHDETKAKLERSEANSSRILKILKKCNSNEDDKMQETEIGDDMKYHITEVEAIKKCLKDRENVVQELKKQMELLKICVAKADKGKSFWTMVSSATTLLAAAAVSLAYVGGGH
ncbi:myosin-13-like [Cynara cardunculus var. scolymus]|uniref:myosin-13-like n=1 Tax=Cynara cardunculus var. scolymus TaxID=59895 RepID=UPI000D627F75|nr:myosin-13-like [Cynara cardunculus var. scolymus]